MDYQAEMKELKARIDRFERVINDLAARQGNDASNITRLADLSDDINARFERVSLIAHERIERLTNRLADIERRID